MAEITKELMYEVLKKIQADAADIQAVLNDHTHTLLKVREDINGLRSNDLRLEVMQAQMDNRLQRIETRLSLTDA